MAGSDKKNPSQKEVIEELDQQIRSYSDRVSHLRLTMHEIRERIRAEKEKKLLSSGGKTLLSGSVMHQRRLRFELVETRKRCWMALKILRETMTEKQRIENLFDEEQLRQEE